MRGRDRRRRVTAACRRAARCHGCAVPVTTGAAADVGCTLVSGWDAPNSNYSSKVITVPANGSAFESWDAGDNGGSRILQPNFNCSLPPGLDIGYFYYDYIADIGD